MLVIGGAGPYKDFVFSVGRTTPTAPNGIQIYSGWHFYIRGNALYDGDDRDTISLAALYSKDVLSYMGEVWQTEINPE